MSKSKAGKSSAKTSRKGSKRSLTFTQMQTKVKGGSIILPGMYSIADNEQHLGVARMEKGSWNFFPRDGLGMTPELMKELLVYIPRLAL